MNKLLALVIALIFINANSVFAQEVSIIGDGSRYYCYLETAEDGDSYVYLLRTSDDSEVDFRRAVRSIIRQINNTKSQIRRNKGRHKDVSALLALLGQLNITRNDISVCGRDGTTGKYAPTAPPTTPPTTPPGDPVPPTGIDACSVVAGVGDFSTRIIGGSQCPIGSSPLVYIEMRDQRGSSTGACTGTVMRRAGQTSSMIVVFAAHCAEGASSVRIQTPAGVMTSNSVYSFPGWGAGGVLENGDVAVAVFSQAIPTHSISLLRTNNLRVGESAVIGGYGVDENGNASSSRLKAGTVTIADVTTGGISIYYRGQGANTCFGDSGGPILVFRNGEWLLAGTTSNGTSNTCGVGDRSNFANITNPAVLAWLDARM